MQKSQGQEQYKEHDQIQEQVKLQEQFEDETIYNLGHIGEFFHEITVF